MEVAGMAIRWLSIISLLFLLTGCASVRDFLGQIESTLAGLTNVDSGPAMTYEDIMDTRNVRAHAPNTLAYATPAAGNGYKWIPPVVQKIRMPAMVRNGVLIPTHEEYVIINDAAYVMEDNRSDTIRSKYRIPEDVEVISPMKGSDVVVAVFRMNPVFMQSTVVPIGKAAFLFEGKAMDRALALQNDELQQVGNYLCSFNHGRGDDFVTVSVAENGLRSIKTFSVTRSQMLFLSNGYVLVPMFEKSNRRGDS
jgi:hypothetical protein